MSEQGRPEQEANQHAQTNIADRRRHLRFLDEVKVRFRDIEGSEPSCWGRSRDLSIGGLGLATPQALKMGSHLALEIHIDSEPAPIVALGRVVRASDDDQNGENEAHSGVEFLWLSVEDRANLARLSTYFQDKYGTSGDLASGDPV